jgi:tetratricopeptide (TPR) repeat protein
MFPLGWLLRIVHGRVFIRNQRAFQHIFRWEYEKAIDEMIQQVAFLEKYPFLDRWRTLLFLDSSQYSYPVTTLNSIAFCYLQVGDVAKAEEYHRRSLAIDPKNKPGLSGVNLINMLSDKPLIPAPPGDVKLSVAVDRKADRWISIIRIGLMLFAPAPVMMILSYFVHWDNDGYAVLFLIMFVCFLLISFLFDLCRFMIGHLLLADLYRGRKLARAGKFEESIRAFEEQIIVLDRSPWIDQYRGFVLLSPLTYSYREWLQISLGDVYFQTGNIQQYIECYQKCLRLNRNNAFARAAIDGVNTILKSLGKPTIDLPPSRQHEH